jgi:hypothetical protein
LGRHDDYFLSIGIDYPTNLLPGSDNSMSAGYQKVKVFFGQELMKGFSGDLVNSYPGLKVFFLFLRSTRRRGKNWRLIGPVVLASRPAALIKKRKVYNWSRSSMDRIEVS